MARKPKWPSKSWEEANYEVLTIGRQSENTLTFGVGGRAGGGRRVFLNRDQVEEVVAWLTFQLDSLPHRPKEEP